MIKRYCDQCEKEITTAYVTNLSLDKGGVLDFYRKGDYHIECIDAVLQEFDQRGEDE